MVQLIQATRRIIENQGRGKRKILMDQLIAVPTKRINVERRLRGNKCKNNEINNNKIVKSKINRIVKK